MPAHPTRFHCAARIACLNALHSAAINQGRLDPLPIRMDYRQTLFASGQGRSLHCPGGKHLDRRGDAVGRHAGGGDERDERISRRTARQDRRPQWSRHRPGLWRTDGRLGEHPRGSAADAGRGRCESADRTTAADELQRTRRGDHRARQHRRRYRRTLEQGSQRQFRCAASGRKQGRDRHSAGREHRRPRGRHDHDHQSAGAFDSLRHGSAAGRLRSRGDLRGRRL